MHKLGTKTIFICTRLASPERSLQNKYMRWKCICSYRGSNFSGWQSQPSGSGVQNHIEAALSSIFDRGIRIHGCSRTDAGVHAEGQCFHFDGDWSYDSAKLIRALHSILDTSIRIESIRSVSDSFHARYSARKKRYCYTIYTGRAHPFDADTVWACRDNPLDFSSMQEASQHFIGRHDFTAFSATPAKYTDPNPVKKIESIIFKQRGARVRIYVTGSGFLYKMVRSIVGTLYTVGRQRLDASTVLHILHSKKRTNQIVTAPASGLSLQKIYYR